MSNVNRLPDSYAKSKESNNYKLLNLNEQAIADAKADAEALFDVLDLQNATGRTLDLYGDIVGQKRGALNDVQYRFLILTKVGMNVSQGDSASIHKILQQIFNCDHNEIILRDSTASAKVTMENFPLDVLLSAGFSSTQAVDIIEMLLPVGVTIDSANFNGTFEFADKENEYDEEAGFGDVEQSIGGYLGLMVGDDENSPILPI